MLCKDTGKVYKDFIKNVSYFSHMKKGLIAYTADEAQLLRMHLIVEAFKLKRELGRAPLANELMPGRRYVQTPYATLFGSYNDFCKAMAFDFFRFKAGQELTGEQLIKIIKKVSKVLGTTPGVKQFEIITSLTLNDVRKHFRNFGKAVAAADPDVKRSRSSHFTNEKLLQILKQLSSKTKPIPEKSDVRRLGVPTVHIYKKRFGSWRKALIAAGFKLPEKKRKPGIVAQRRQRVKELLKQMSL